MLEHDGRTAVDWRVPVAPGEERHHHRPEVDPLLAEAILEALRPLLVAHALEDALLDEPLETTLKHVARYAEAALEVLEAANSEERVPDDQEGPAFAHDLEGASHRADLTFIRPPQHGRECSRARCMTQLTLIRCVA